MTTPLTIYNNPLAIPSKVSGMLPAFQAGQILMAVAVTDSKHGRAILRIGNHEVSAETKMPISQGNRLVLEVTQLLPKPELKLLSGTSLNPSAVDRVLQAAMERFLPQQKGITHLLTELGLKLQGNHKSAIPSNTRHIAEHLLNGLTERHQIMKAEGLRLAIQQSGLFLETKLATSIKNISADIPGDFKAQLLRLLRSLTVSEKKSGAMFTKSTGNAIPQENNQPHPPRPGVLPEAQPRAYIQATTSAPQLTTTGLREQAEGALARLTLHQLATIENISDKQLMWQMEIPVRQHDEIDMISLCIEKEQKNEKDSDNETWNIALALDLPILGPVQMRLTYGNGELSSIFWSEYQDTISTISSELEQLRSNLMDHGLEVSNLTCRPGKPPQSTSTSSGTTIIDVQV